MLIIFSLLVESIILLSAFSIRRIKIQYSVITVYVIFTRYVKLFHDKNYESVLEGEIIETGVGIVLRKKMSHLGELFIFKSKKKK